MRVNSFVQGHTGRTFTGVQEQFWPDAFPATTNDSYGYLVPPEVWTQVCWI